MSTLVRYSLFQIPGTVVFAGGAWAAYHWALVPAWGAWLAFGAWVVKDVAVYPLVRAAYERSEGADDKLSGLSGRVSDRLDPTGYVLVRGERWKATLVDDAAPVEVGASVVVVAVDGLVLRVRRVRD